MGFTTEILGTPVLDSNGRIVVTKMVRYLFADDAEKAQIEALAEDNGYVLEIVNDEVHLTLWRNDDDKKFMVAVRGAFLKDQAEVRANMAALKGEASNNPRFTGALAFVQSVQLENPDYTVEISGHSLGGVVCAFVTRRLGINAYAFNPYATAQQVRLSMIKIKGVYGYRNMHLYLTVNDAVNVQAYELQNIASLTSRLYVPHPQRPHALVQWFEDE